MHPRRRIVLGIAAWLLGASAGAAERRTRRAAAKRVALVDDDAPDAVSYGSREDVLRFADAVAERRGLDAEWVQKSLAQARFQPLVVRYIMRSSTETPEAAKSPSSGKRKSRCAANQARSNG